MKMPSDAVLKRAWRAGERWYRKYVEMKCRRQFKWASLNRLWGLRRGDTILTKQLRAIARVILQEQGKGKKGKVTSRQG